MANAASRATPSPSANAQVACHARRDARGWLFTTVNDAWKEKKDASLASAAYSTSSAHLEAQSAASRAHHPPGAPLGEHTRVSSAMAVRREPPASSTSVRASASNGTGARFEEKEFGILFNLFVELSWNFPGTMERSPLQECRVGAPPLRVARRARTCVVRSARDTLRNLSSPGDFPSCRASDHLARAAVTSSHRCG